MRMRWYVGYTDTGWQAFKSDTEPTWESHEHLYAPVIGPFRTKRAAVWAERYGKGNPHFSHVNDAERLALHPCGCH